MSTAGRSRTAATVPHPDVPPVPGRWWREHAGLVDLLVGLAVFLYNVPILPVSVPSERWRPVMHVLSAGMCAVYLLRRRFPLAVFWAILLLATLQVLLGTSDLPADAMLLFATYSVASRFGWRISLPAAGLVVMWFLGAQLPKLGENYLDVSDLIAVSAVIVLAWMWGTLVRTRRDYIASLHERARQLERERDSQAQVAVAEERARIAREIHDIVSHSLSVVVVMAEGAASKVDAEPERARAAMLSVRDTGRGALTEMRRMLGVLRADEPGSHRPQPGVAQLDQLVEESRRSGLPVRMTVEGSPSRLSQGLDLTVYRVVQEALTNVRKHAGGSVTRVDVRLRYTDTRLEVRVTDDGRGFPDGAGDHREGGQIGHGLLGMRERVGTNGGSLRAGMRPSGGFEVTAVLPLQEEA